jgi:hypothetical protein
MRSPTPFVSNQRRLGWCALGGLALLALLSLGCIAEGEVASVPAPESADEAAAIRTCEEILDTAFRSEAERQQFEANCSRWPQVSVPQTAPVAAPPESSECAALRGRPYESPDQRRWYLENCQGGGSSPPPATGGPDRTDCNAIRGTPYHSATERAWFLLYCQTIGITRFLDNNDDDRGGNNGRGNSNRGRGNDNDDDDDD